MKNNKSNNPTTAEGPAVYNALQEVGHKLVENGYRIIPIHHKSKRPPNKGWGDRSKTFNVNKLLNSYPYEVQSNVGVDSFNIVSIDIDVYDGAISKQLFNYLCTNFDGVVGRVGESPKILVPMRLDESEGVASLSKFSTPKYYQDDKSAQIEILGDGQQFVAYGTHPNGSLYSWYKEGGKSCAGISDIHIDDLPTITLDQLVDLFSEFERLLTEAGWEKKSRGTSRITTPEGDVLVDLHGSGGGNVVPFKRGIGAGVKGGDEDEIDSFDDFDKFLDQGGELPLANITEEKAREYLNAIPNDGDKGTEEIDYDDWYRIICGIHHQFGGSEVAYDLALEFSMRSPKHDQHMFEHTIWPYIKSDRGNPVTFATVIHWAKPHIKASAIVSAEALTRELEEDVTDRQSLEVFCDKVRSSVLDKLDREIITGLVSNKMKDVMGLSRAPAISLVRGKLKPDNKVERIQGDYDFCEPYVYIKRLDAFYNLNNNEELLDVNVFNRTYSVNLLTEDDIAEGRARNARQASDVALNIYKVPHAYDFRYCPDETRVDPQEPFIVHDEGVRYLNNYQPSNVAMVPEKDWSVEQREAVEAFKRHVLLTCGEDTRDAEMVMSWFAHKWRNPSVKIGWAPVFQAGNGTGKSFFFRFVRELFGSRNVVNVSSDMIKEKYNGWAANCLINTVDELRLVGMGKFDAANRLKPVVSEVRMSLRMMHKDAAEYDLYNDLLITTNYQNAIPFDQGERRYYPTFGKLQTEEQVRQFKLAHPEYFKFLFGVYAYQGRGVLGCPANIGAIAWFLYHYEAHAEFVTGDAPESKAGRVMKDNSLSNVENVLRDIVEEGGGRFINDKWVVAPAVVRVFNERFGHLQEYRKDHVDTVMVCRVLRMMGYEVTDRDHRVRLTRHFDGMCSVGVRDKKLIGASSSELRREIYRSKLPDYKIDLGDDFLDHDDLDDEIDSVDSENNQENNNQNDESDDDLGFLL